MGIRASARSECSAALLERGIVPDVVIGTSAGALNGAAVCTSPTLEKIDELEEVWVALTGEQNFPAGAFKRGLEHPPT